jgi:hypothetical protein
MHPSQSPKRSPHPLSDTLLRHFESHEVACMRFGFVISRPFLPGPMGTSSKCRDMRRSGREKCEVREESRTGHLQKNHIAREIPGVRGGRPNGMQRSNNIDWSGHSSRRALLRPCRLPHQSHSPRTLFIHEDVHCTAFFGEQADSLYRR